MMYLDIVILSIAVFAAYIALAVSLWKSSRNDS